MIMQTFKTFLRSTRARALTHRLLAVIVLFCASFAVKAEPVIRSYDPMTTEPESVVYIHGTGLREFADANLCWGVAGRAETLGTIGSRAPEILSWVDRTIHLRLSASLTEGRYWIGICRGSRLLSNQLESLQVTGVATAPVVTGYNPTYAAPGGRVIIYGRRLGPRTPGERIRYGTGLRPEGNAEVLRWSDTEIEVRIPADMRSGTYWLAVYRVDELLSNLNKALQVRIREEMALPPGQEGDYICSPA
jgi:hypothetical protein